MVAREGERINLWQGKHKFYRYYRSIISRYSNHAYLRIWLLASLAYTLCANFPHGPVKYCIGLVQTYLSPLWCTITYNMSSVLSKSKKYISVKTEIQTYQHMACDLDLSLNPKNKSVSKSLKIRMTSDKPQSNTKSQYLGLLSLVSWEGASLEQISIKNTGCPCKLKFLAVEIILVSDLTHWSFWEEQDWLAVSSIKV